LTNGGPYSVLALNPENDLGGGGGGVRGEGARGCGGGVGGWGGWNELGTPFQKVKQGLRWNHCSSQVSRTLFFYCSLLVEVW